MTLALTFCKVFEYSQSNLTCRPKSVGTSKSQNLSTIITNV